MNLTIIYMPTTLKSVYPFQSWHSNYTLLSHCLLNVTTWLSDRHFDNSMFKMKRQILLLSSLPRPSLLQFKVSDSNWLISQGKTLGAIRDISPSLRRVTSQLSETPTSLLPQFRNPTTLHRLHSCHLQSRSHHFSPPGLFQSFPVLSDSNLPSLQPVLNAAARIRLFECRSAGVTAKLKTLQRLFISP